MNLQDFITPVAAVTPSLKAGLMVQEHAPMFQVVDRKKRLPFQTTRKITESALWPAMFKIIVREANKNGEPDKRLDVANKLFTDDIQFYADHLRRHQDNSFKKALDELAEALFALTYDKQASGGKGSNSVPKTVGVLLAIFQNCGADFTDTFEKAIALVDESIADHFGKEWGAMLDSGSIEKAAIKGLKWLKENNYYGG